MPEIYSAKYRAAHDAGEAAYCKGIDREANPHKHKDHGATAEEFDEWTGWNDGWWSEYWFAWDERNRR